MTTVATSDNDEDDLLFLLPQPASIMAIAGTAGFPLWLLLQQVIHKSRTTVGLLQ